MLMQANWDFWVLAGTLAVMVDLALRALFAMRVLLLRRPVGFQLSWLLVIVLVPFFGSGLYLFFGERKLGTHRARKAKRLLLPYFDWIEKLAQDHPTATESGSALSRNVAKQTSGVAGLPTLAGNSLQLLPTSKEFFDSLIEDIQAAKSTCHLEFYIWEDGGRVNDVMQALIEAAGRGIKTRILIDAIGGMSFLGGEWHDKLKQAGIEVHEMLPVGFFRALFARIDLRNHRKIIVIDGSLAYMGSHNMTDPIEHPDPDAGQWVDAMTRMTGPAVEALQLTFLGDLDFETDDDVLGNLSGFDLIRQEADGSATVQVMPSDPVNTPRKIHPVLQSAFFNATRKLTLTTPYYVPDEATCNALCAASARGVAVKLVLPARSDSRFIRWASSSYFEHLLAAGVEIHRFEQGLLHTKAITVDDELSIFGSVNLDMRSMYLNFEISLIVYDEKFTKSLTDLQQQYIDNSSHLLLKDWQKRSIPTRLLHSIARLFSPML
ncbi:MAG: cardiolipin synthase [Planctomycetes bacterium]|nr:cardiolipin synthase [Planctomycetota bacterium]